MSENIPQNPMDTENNYAKILQENRAYMITLYIFFLLGIFGVTCSTLIGVVMAYLKRGQVANTLYESHCTWLIRTFWISVVLLVIFCIGFGFFILPFWAVSSHHFFFNGMGFWGLQWGAGGLGLLLLLLLPLWYMGRVIYGFIRLLYRQEINAYAWLC